MRTALLLSLALLVACDDTPNGPRNGRPGDLEESLAALGVSLEPTDPVGPNGVVLDVDSAPLGGQATVGRVAELVMLGIPREDSPTGFTVLEQDPDRDVHTLLAPETAEFVDAPWRAMAASDLDGDGREEIAVVVQQEGNLVVWWADDVDGTWTWQQKYLQPSPTLTSLSVAGGDLDGNGWGDLVIAAGTTGSVSLLYVKGGDSLVFAGTTEITSPRADARLDVTVRTGNLDPDNALEVAYAVTEDGGLGANAWWGVLDDAGHDFATKREGALSVTDPATGSLVPATVASLDLGDLDGDGLDEVALGGLMTPISSCNDDSTQVLLAIDDLTANLRTLSQGVDVRRYRPCSSVSAWRVNMALVGAFDIDGDGIDEVHVNDGIYDDVAAGTWTPTWAIPADQIFPLGDTHGGRWEPARAAMTTGDFDHDGREDIALFNTNVNGGITVFGIDGPNGVNGFQKTSEIPAGSGTRGLPLLLDANVDDDSTVVSYDEGSYEFVFTEPVVLAVLAAPPCHEGAGQDDGGSCTTSFGLGSLSGSTSSDSISTTVSAHVGWDVSAGFGPIEVGASETFTAMQTRAASYERGYSLEKTITYTSGSMEDAVVFTSIPYDRYTYTIASHPDPALIGSRVVVSLPREPVTLIAERGYFNDHLVEGAPKVDETVIDHTVGDVWSYPTAPSGEGVDSNVATVGQGSGETEVEVVVTDEVTRGGSLEVGFQIDAEVTGGGVVAGWSVGATHESSFTVTSGTSTTYRGAVGSLPGEGYQDQLYSFGLYTRVHTDTSGREYQVLDYWVE